MTLKITSILTFILVAQIGTAQETLKDLLKKYNKDAISYISVTELQQLQSQGHILLLDSREKKEFEVSHISSAIFVGYDHFSIDEFSEMIQNKNTPIVVYCTLGIRSEVIADKLIKAGFTHVKNLYGGILEWKNKGLTVVDTYEIVTENIHTFSKEWSKWLLNGNPIY